MTVAVPRGVWGARHARYPAGLARRGEEVIHITETPDLPADASPAVEAAAMRAIERYVVTRRGFRGFPYSHVGFDSGRVYEGQGWGRDGAHTQQGRNRTAYALARYGRHTTSPPARWFRGARLLFAEGIAQGWLPVTFAITGHRDYAAKACPGDALYRRREECRPTGEEDDMPDGLAPGDTGAEVVYLCWRLNDVLHGESDPRDTGKPFGLAVRDVYDDEVVRYVSHVQAGWNFRRWPGYATSPFLVRLERVAAARRSRI